MTGALLAVAAVVIGGAVIIAGCVLLFSFLSPLFLALMEEAEYAGERVAQALYTLKRRLQGKPDHGFDSCPTGSVPRGWPYTPQEKPQVGEPFDR